MPTTVTNSREFRPVRWLAAIAVLCLLVYVAGVTAASSADDVKPAAVCPAH
jgi:hypothetical protein